MENFPNFITLDEAIDYSQLRRSLIDTWNEVEREEVSQASQRECWFVKGSSGHRWPLIDQRVNIIEGVINGQSMNGRDFGTVLHAIVVTGMKKVWEEEENWIKFVFSDFFFFFVR